MRIRSVGSNWRKVLPWAALAAFLLMAVSAFPHLHDEVDEQSDRCVLCHAQDAPIIASGLPANPDPVVLSAGLPVAPPRIHGMTPAGRGSRAPPA